MMRALIFANGRIEDPQSALETKKPDDLIIAADGGARHCKKIGILPVVIIGDMDSLDQGEVNSFEKEGTEIIRHSPQKDFTDLDLAFILAKERGVDEIIVFGGIGSRWDMTLSNMLLSTKYEFRNMEIRFLDGSKEASLIRGGQERILQGSKGDTLSLVTIGEDAVGITLSGLEYPLENATLPAGSSKGISNVFTWEKVSIKLTKGILMCIVNRQSEHRTSNIEVKKTTNLDFHS